MVLSIEIYRRSGTILEHVARVGKSLGDIWSNYGLIKRFMSEKRPNCLLKAFGNRFLVHLDRYGL